MRLSAALRFVAVLVMASVVGVASSPLHLATRQIPGVPATAVNSWDHTIDAEEHLEILAALSSQRWLDAQPDIPVRLQIPSIGLDTQFEEIGLTATNAVDVPLDPNNVGWLDRTVRPGWPGSSLIDGHFDTTTGPAALYHLKDVRETDKIVVVDAVGRSWKFVVDAGGISTIDSTRALPSDLFRVGGSRTLTLMTCYGKWVPAIGTYDKRLLVRATLVS